MKRLTKDEIREAVSLPNGAEKLITDENMDLESLFKSTVELFLEEGSASALLLRFANKKQYLIRMSENYEFLSKLTDSLRAENAKLRRNAARLAGALKRSEFVPRLISAINVETQRFVKPAILLALGSIGGDVARNFLCGYKPAPAADATEEKHFAEEQRALIFALRSTAPKEEHIFTGLNDEYTLELRAPDMLTRALFSELSELDFEPFDDRRNSLKVKTADYASLFEARCFKEALFVIGGVTPTPTTIAKKAIPFIEKLMRSTHTGKPPYRFRVELDIDVGDRNAFIADICSKIEEESVRLANAPSDYEVELRIEGNSASARLYAKLFTFKDERFGYRAESIPASIDPSVAAAMLRMASEHLSVNARVIDPCCGSGTLLIERGKLSPCSSLTGVDIAHSAIDVARRNTELSGIDAKYVVNDILRFVCHRPYDELICNLPFGNRVGTHSSCERLYAGLLDQLPKLVKKGGVAIFYTMEFTLLKKLLRERSSYLSILKQERTEAGGLTPMIFVVRVNA